MIITCDWGYVKTDLWLLHVIEGMLKPIYDYYMWLRVEVTVKEYVNVIANGRQCEQTEVAAVNHSI